MGGHPDAAGSEDRERGRKGSTCKTLRPLPTFVKVESQGSTEAQDRLYFKKEILTDEEVDHNEKLFEDTMVLLFPEERMKDRFFRDKDKEMAIRTWILSVYLMIGQEMILFIFKL